MHFMRTSMLLCTVAAVLIFADRADSQEQAYPFGQRTPFAESAPAAPTIRSTGIQPIRTVSDPASVAPLGHSMSGPGFGHAPAPVSPLQVAQQPANEEEDNDEGDEDDEDPSLDDFEKRLAKLEKRWDTQEELNDELGFRVLPGTSGTSEMKIVGRVHTDHWAFPQESDGVNAFERGDSRLGPQDRIGFRRIRFGVRGDVKDLMTYRIEMEFAGANNSEIRDVWLGFKDMSVFQTVIIGNHKRPYGLDHRNSSRYNVFIERPFFIEANNQDARRLGISSRGYTDDLRYNWQFGVYNQQNIQALGNYISDHYQAEATGRFASTVWYDEVSDGRGYAHLGISGSLAHPDGDTPTSRLPAGPAANQARFRTRPEARSTNRWIDTGRIDGTAWYTLLGLEGVVNVGPTQVVGEYQHIWLSREDRFGGDIQFNGAYGYISYFLTGEHIPWNRRSAVIGRVEPFENFFLVDRCNGRFGHGWGAWQVAARYSYSDYTDDNIFGGVGKALTLGLNWHWNPNASLQFNYILGHISDRMVADANPATAFQTSGKYQIAGTRFRIDF